jgi:uncharacterized membrane protein
VKTRPYLITAALVVVGMLAVSAWAWPQIPDGAQVPIHWGIDGRANGWAPKWQGLLLLPAMTGGIALVLAFAPRVDPRSGNIQRSATAYWAIAVAALVLMAVIHVAAVLAATGRSVNIGLIVSLAVGGLFVVVGNFLGKTRSSWIFGIRTPWTLSSELAWTRTHRLGGYLFMLLGVAVIAAALLAPGGVPAFLLLGGVVVLVPLLFAYSYLVWRDDPERQRVGANQ